MRVITQSLHEPPGPGEWYPWTVEFERTALFGCPECGAVGTLEHYDIAADGKVAEPVTCAHGDDFHEPIILQGWRPS